MTDELPAERAQGEPVDHVAELIDSIARQLADDPAGQEHVTFARGDGRRLVRVPTFYSELFLPWLDKLRAYRGQEGGAALPVELEREGEQLREQREQRIRAWLEERREQVALYVEGD